MGRRALAAIAFAALGAAAAAEACSSFDEETPPPTADDGGTDATSDTARDAATDAADAAEREASPPREPTVLATIPGAIAIAVANNDAFVGRAAGGILRVSVLDPDAGTSALTTKPRALGAIAVAGGAVFWVDPLNSDRGKVATAGGGEVNREETALLALATVSSTSVVAIQTGAAQNEVREYDVSTINAGNGYAAYGTLADVSAGGGRIYWTESSTGKVYRATVGSFPSIASFASTETGCGSIAADTVGAYWATPGGVRFVRHADSIPKPLATDTNATSLVAENGVVYWLTKGASGSLRRLDVDAAETPPETLATNLLVNFGPEVQAIALTPAYVVWITSDGRVLRLDR